MAKFKKISHGRHEGKIVVDSGILDGIVVLAVEEIPNVELSYPVFQSKMISEAVKIGYEKNGVTVQVYIKVNYLDSISDISFKVQETIRHNIETMTDYNVVSVNVFVTGVNFDEVEHVSPFEQVSISEIDSEEKQTEETPKENV